jgi:sporulation protein YhbH
MIAPMSLSKNDWALHRKGTTDAQRHAEKVKEAIKESLPQVVAEEAIITSSGDTRVKVPIRSLELPRFRYDYGRNKHVGQGEGGSQPGDQVAGPGKGGQAGKEPGVDYVEAEISIDDLASILFEDLGLPNLEKKQSETIDSSTLRYNEVARRGQMANLDKRRTIMQNIKRNALKGRPRFADVKDDDLRFRISVPEVKRETNAVILAMRDVSGSMGEFEKYISRSFYFWMLRFLRTKYERVQVAFITHHTEAREVDEDTFFKLGESGGTKASSAYELALQIVRQRYDPGQWNVYPFHFSDGDNWGDTDNRRCFELVEELIGVSSAVGYGEIRQGGSRSTSTLMSAFQAIADPKFIRVEIHEKQDVYPALRRFFSPGAVGGLPRAGVTV